MADFEPGGIYRDPETNEWIVFGGTGYSYRIFAASYTLPQIQLARDEMVARDRAYDERQEAEGQRQDRLERVPESAVDGPAPAPPAPAPPAPVSPPARRTGFWRRK